MTRTTQVFETFGICLIVFFFAVFCIATVLGAIDREMQIREQAGQEQSADYCRAHPTECDVAGTASRP